MAAQARKPAVHVPPVEKAAAHKARRGPPAKGQVAGPGIAATKATPKPRQSIAELQNAIANAAGMPPKDVKCFLDALHDVAARSLRETNVFKIHNIVLIRMRKTSPRNAVTRKIFGKEVVLPAKPAGKKISAVAVKPLYDAVNTGE